jgi:5-methylcytosine-specific restriction enzyme A
MALMFSAGAFYSRVDVWDQVRPGKDFPAAGDWHKAYVEEGADLFIFAEIEAESIREGSFGNSFDLARGIFQWYGKPNSHSAQPVFEKLFQGRLTPYLFVRWTEESKLFCYLGEVNIEDYGDNIGSLNGISAIKVSFSIIDSEAGLPARSVEKGDLESLEGGRLVVQVNRYERDPRLRALCLEKHGASCTICGFDFEKVYGPLGRGFCHVHHLEPLSEVKESHLVNPETDLVPVCPNCHAMIHSRFPALSLADIHAAIKQRSLGIE